MADTPGSERARDRFDRPILIVSTPRSGSTLLFETLERAPGLFTTGRESHRLIESIPGLSPMDHGWHSNRLTATEATPAIADRLAVDFWANLSDRDGRPPEGRVRMLEKTPKNALRLPFFDRVFPDCQFVFLYRDVRQTLSSMIEAWSTGRFRTYPRLDGWHGPAWSLLLVPGWRGLDGLPLPEIVAHQWAITMNQLVDDLERLSPDRVVGVDYGALIAQPDAVVRPLASRLDLGWDQPLGPTLPLSKTTVSRPGHEKWRQVAHIIEPLWPIVASADARARALLDRLESPTS